MVLQSKIAVDHAKKAGVKQIVHVGVFSLDSDCTVPHFAWHQGHSTPFVKEYQRKDGSRVRVQINNVFLNKHDDHGLGIFMKA